ncbi:MAG: serine hydroxymethyltransferase [Bacteroidota bacterium]
MSVVDPALAALLAAELRRQQETLILIASENYLDEELIRFQGNVLTNKYAEGYPEHRYYRGNEFADGVERLAVERAKEAFGMDHANVQPHSGSQANAAAYRALIKPGDTVLSMDLSHGGHLTHGSPVNFSGQDYRIVHYGVDPVTERLDYEACLALALAHRPRLIMTGATAYPRHIDFARWRQIADRVGAYLVADISHIAGLVVAGLHPNPAPYADVVTTTTHKTLNGPRGALILCRAEHAKAIDRAVFPGLQGGPMMHIIAAKAAILGYARSAEFADYQRRVVENARRLAEELMARGFRLVSGGTDNHLLILDVRPYGLTGKAASLALEQAGIMTNMNTIPFDPEKPAVTSGVRLGTPALTRRGFGPAEMAIVADYISRVLQAPADAAVKERVRREIADLCAGFPVYKGLEGAYWRS